MAETDLLNFEGRLSTLEERSNSQATKADLANLKADLINGLSVRKLHSPL